MRKAILVAQHNERQCHGLGLKDFTVRYSDGGHSIDAHLKKTLPKSADEDMDKNATRINRHPKHGRNSWMHN